MKPNVITYNSTISACEKGQEWIMAMTLLREMQQWHMKPDVITYSSSISACEKGQQCMREGPAVDHEARRDHLQFQHQCMREGPAVDHSHDLAPGDAAVANEAGCDHIQFQHQCMREGPAVDHS